MPKKPMFTPNGHRLSHILQELMDGLSGPSMTLGELRELFANRMYGCLLFILALPNLIPAPAPGLSAVMGGPLVFLTFQMMLGYKTPWFPPFIAKRRLKTDAICRVCTRAMPSLKALERWVKPRWLWLVHAPMDRLIALVCLVLSVAILMPIPFGNALPALAICFFSIALLQRDGLFVVLGFITALLAVSIISAAGEALVSTLQNWLS